MKPERIEEIQKTCREYREDGCAYGPHVYLDEMDHLLRCARAWAELGDALERASDIRFAEYDRADVRGVRVEWRVGGVLEGLWDPDLLTATEAALARAKENPDAT